MNACNLVRMNATARVKIGTYVNALRLRFLHYEKERNALLSRCFVQGFVVKFGLPHHVAPCES